MKRSELKVGDHLYHAKPGNWQNDYVGHDAHVVVASVEPHTRESFGRRTPMKTRSGGGVLVKVVDNGRPESEWHETVVRIGDLRGPYEETLKEIRERQAQQHAAREAADAAREDAHARAQQQVTRMRGAGLPSAYASTPISMVKIKADEVIALLDKVDALAREIEDLKQQLWNTGADLNAAHARPAIPEE